jgi:hypothetical protein
MGSLGSERRGVPSSGPRVDWRCPSLPGHGVRPCGAMTALTGVRHGEQRRKVAPITALNSAGVIILAGRKPFTCPAIRRRAVPVKQYDERSTGGERMQAPLGTQAMWKGKRPIRSSLPPEER